MPFYSLCSFYSALGEREAGEAEKAYHTTPQYIWAGRWRKVEAGTDRDMWQTNFYRGELLYGGIPSILGRDRRGLVRMDSAETQVSCSGLLVSNNSPVALISSSLPPSLINLLPDGTLISHCLPALHAFAVPTKKGREDLAWWETSSHGSCHLASIVPVHSHSLCGLRGMAWEHGMAAHFQTLYY